MSADGLKSSFDLAMERLARKGEVLSSLTDDQKAALADVAARSKAKIAEVEILYGKKLAEAQAAGDAEKAGKIEEERRLEIARIKEREEAERRKIRD